MIYGEIKDIKIYKGLSKNLDKAIEYISEKKYKDNHFGKNEIDGDIIYFNCPEKAITRDKNGLELEYHKKYIDIHIVLEGEESIGYSAFNSLIETKKFDIENDYALMKGDIQTEFYLDKEKFLIIFPYEAHIALLKVGKEKEIKKVIFKVEI
ncbi:MAG: YhcH/YjgK/YiaL family protein [Fusobacterium sp.]|uniref:YhcH/YjgK/YiaL family protein n=1 Tax=Fusobacterium sp. TaxID=68766 RepID=UPI0026DA999A|nr:YhcH/YjgK/YiaL family protein [Fusobacterium sp.]MDO4690940.1 YhcH/YjgK/YiaL family protein [Fusobacterium sp.]